MPACDDVLADFVDELLQQRRGRDRLAPALDGPFRYRSGAAFRRAKVRELSADRDQILVKPLRQFGQLGRMPIAWQFDEQGEGFLLLLVVSLSVLCEASPLASLLTLFLTLRLGPLLRDALFPSSVLSFGVALCPFLML
jgi:hypothetical protein